MNLSELPDKIRYTYSTINDVIPIKAQFLLTLAKQLKQYIMGKSTDLGLLILRVGLSVLMLTHGYGKFRQLLDGDMSFGNPLGIGAAATLVLAVIGEFLCPVLIILGVKTRLATIIPIITMAVAAFMVHGADPIGTKEKALLYLIGFIAIGLMGAGKFSVDRK